MVHAKLPTETADLGAFELHLTRLDADLALRGRPLFTGDEAPIAARAPGRLDVMGGIADYSGSLTLEMPIAEAAFVSVQRTRSEHVRIVSAGFGQNPPPPRDVSLPAEEVRRACRSYAEARAYFSRNSSDAWVAYVAGALAALQIEHGASYSGGLDILLCSSVPEGKGVSSSAAVEVASFGALAALCGVDIDPASAALTCQKVENLVVGAPCGVMDPLTSSCGSAGRLLPILCQPAMLEERFEIPESLGIWGIDSGVRHQVGGAEYGDVRVAAFMGYTIIASLLKLPIRRLAEPGKVAIDDPLYKGYLANVSVQTFEEQLAAALPEQLSGTTFLRDYAGIIDPITHVVPSRSYRVRAATAHPIYEHARVREFRDLMLRQGSAERLGRLMYLAHESYGACGLGSTGTDLLVELVRRAGLHRGLYGAKITGGGSGGTVAVLGASDAGAAVLDVVDAYARETGHTPRVFSGSSCGAAEFGIARLSRNGGTWRVERGSTPPEARPSPALEPKATR